jgi:hypothetical protein
MIYYTKNRIFHFHPKSTKSLKNKLISTISLGSLKKKIARLTQDKMILTNSKEQSILLNILYLITKIKNKMILKNNKILQLLYLQNFVKYSKALMKVLNL